MPIDTVAFDFVQVDHLTMEIIKSPPQDGCYIRGLYLEGARWDYTTHVLAESRPKELYTDLPIMWLDPKQFRVQPTDGFYNCPVYKTLVRAGKKKTHAHTHNSQIFKLRTHYKETVSELSETCPNQYVINDIKLIENCPK